MTDIVERFEAAVRANGLRIRGDLSELEYRSAKDELSALLSSLRSRAEKAEAELATSNKMFCSMLTTGVCDLPERLQKAEATCEKLATALQPFAEVDPLDVYDGHDGFEYQVLWKDQFSTARSDLSEYRKEASE